MQQLYLAALLPYFTDSADDFVPEASARRALDRVMLYSRVVGTYCGPRQSITDLTDALHSEVRKT